MAPNRRRPPRRPRTRRATQPAKTDPSFTALVASQLPHGEEHPWAAGADLPPLPPEPHDLLELASPLLLTGTRQVAGGDLTLTNLIGHGYGVAAVEGPDFLLGEDVRVDVLDLMFYAAAWPQQLRDGVEFGIGRDLWLATLTAGPDALDLARIVAATLDVSYEISAPLDSPACWLGTLIRLDQARIGRKPLASAVSLRRDLGDSRFAQLMAGTYTPELPMTSPGAAARVDALIAHRATPADQSTTVLEAVRRGLAVLIAALTTDPAVLEDIFILISTWGEDDVASRAALTEQLDEQLDTIDHPHALAGAVPDDLVHRFVDGLDGNLLLGALRLGAVSNTSRGQLLADTLPWAYGLAPSCPLVPLVDTLLTGMYHSGEVPHGLALLAQALSATAVEQDVPHADWGFHGRPGTAVARFAMAGGAPDITFQDGWVTSADGAAAALLHEQLQRFEERFGRPPRPDDVIFFDPMSDDPQPQPMPVEAFSAVQAAMYEELGVSDLVRLAAGKYTTLPVPSGGRFSDPERQDEWDDALQSAAADLGIREDDIQIIADADYRTLDGFQVMWLLQMMQRSDDLAHGVVASLRTIIDGLRPNDEIEVAAGPGYESSVVAFQLHYRTPLLLARARPGWDVDAAVAAARRWADRALGEQVRHLGAQVESWPDLQLDDEDPGGRPDTIDWSLVPAAAVLVAVTMP